MVVLPVGTGGARWRSQSGSESSTGWRPKPAMPLQRWSLSALDRPETFKRTVRDKSLYRGTDH